MFASVALAQSLVSRVCQMSLRVAHILDAKRPTRNGLWKPVLGVSAALLALVLGQLHTRRSWWPSSLKRVGTRRRQFKKRSEQSGMKRSRIAIAPGSEPY